MLVCTPLFGDRSACHDRPETSCVKATRPIILTVNLSVHAYTYLPHCDMLLERMPTYDKQLQRVNLLEVSAPLSNHKICICIPAFVCNPL